LSNTIILASFDKTKLLRRCGERPADVHFRGYLKDGRSFGDTYKIIIK
jgi:hypothetical protein